MNRRQFLTLASAAAAAAAIPARASAATAARPPELGTCALTTAEYDATRATAGVAMPWNVTYQSIGEPFDAALATALAARGVTRQVITVEMWLSGDRVLRRIAAGELDGQLRRLAGEMRSWAALHPQVELILRPLHEADGGPSWRYPWCFGGGYRGNTMADFRPAWWHTRAVVRSVMPGLAFAWSPNGVPSSVTGRLRVWSPGNNNMEYVAPDYYNRSQSDGGWRTPAQLWGHTLREIRSFVHVSKPIVITETATSEPHPGLVGRHSKVEWYGQFGQWLRTDAAAANVAGVCVFDRDRSGDNAGGNGNDWRFGATAANRDAFRAAVRGLGA